MSTRCTTHFKAEGDDAPTAIIYRHSDGYPEGHGADLVTFFDEVEKQCNGDTRFGDPSYLAAKLVVWLGEQFARPTFHPGPSIKRYTDDEAKALAAQTPLKFLGVGVVMEDPGDIEYRYTVVCSGDWNHRDQRPTILTESL